jgi:hypothetical protein
LLIEEAREVFAEIRFQAAERLQQGDRRKIVCGD